MFLVTDEFLRRNLNSILVINRKNTHVRSRTLREDILFICKYVSCDVAQTSITVMHMNWAIVVNRSIQFL